MKSLVIAKVFQNPESDQAKTFSKGLKAFLSLKEEQKKTIIDFLPSVRIARTASLENQIVKEIASKAKISIAEASEMLASLLYLMNSFMERSLPVDDHKGWMSDLREVSVLSDSNEEKTFEDLLSTIQVAIVSQVEPEIKRRRAAMYVGPFLKSISVSVGIVPVIENYYRYGNSLDSYEPEIVDTVVVGSVRLSLDEGIAEEVSFHIDADVLDMTINTLMAAKKNMDALRKYLKI